MHFILFLKWLTCLRISVAKFSVITINYNNCIGLEKTMNSVFNQTFKDVEYIVIDGGSNDGSKELIERNASRITKWVSEKDSGIYNAQNKGAKLSTGDYCLFLNSGDVLFEPETLSLVQQNMNNKSIVYGDLVTINKKGEKKRENSPDNLNVYHFMISTLWHPCTFIKRSVFLKYGFYKEEFKITGDYEFFIRTVLKNNVDFLHINVPISVFDLSGVSNSPSNLQIQMEERRRSLTENYPSLVVKMFELYTKIRRKFE